MVVRTPPGRAAPPPNPGISAEARWLFVGCVLTGICVAAFWPPSLKDNSPVVRQLMNSGHLPAFAMLMFATWLTLRDSRSAAIRLIRAAGVSLAAVVAVEIVQPVVGRTASYYDLFQGSAGILLVASVIGLRECLNAAQFLSLGALAAVFMLFWLIRPAAIVALDMRDLENQFPLLGGFEAPRDIRWWRAKHGGNGDDTTISRSNKHALIGNHSLKIKTGKGSGKGVSLPVVVRDWHAFKTLSFVAFNPGQGFRLKLVIDGTRDERGHFERFRATTNITDGDNVVEIELNKQRNPRFDFSAVARLTLFTGRNQPSRVFYLDQVRLR